MLFKRTLPPKQYSISRKKCLYMFSTDAAIVVHKEYIFMNRLNIESYFPFSLHLHMANSSLASWNTMEQFFLNIFDLWFGLICGCPPADMKGRRYANINWFMEISMYLEE